ncbi:MAG: hypothetical protein KAR33_12705, partial [Candidatus Thorarchaeota archaeon]|nr:hypothetical protein [Candidatus Thorarchaeota archaeon]
IQVQQELLDLEICDNTGLYQHECQCLDCVPWIWRFKEICTDCETVSDVVERLEDTLAYFSALNDGDYTISGAIEHDYMELKPPSRQGLYWMRCDDCGSLFEVPIGSLSLSCGMCKQDSMSEGEIYY